MGLFSKKKHYEPAPAEEEFRPLSDSSLSELKNLNKTKWDSFFNTTQTIGALEIDDIQNMWRSMSFNPNVAFKFHEIISIGLSDEATYQTQETSYGKTSGNAGKALVGGLVAGGVGAVVGAAGSRTQVTQSSAITTTSNTFIVSICTSIPKYENITIESTSAAEAQLIANTLQERIANLPPVYEQPSEPKPEEAPAASSPAETSPADEIRKYKGLLDDGIISQPEFEAKKKQLLGI